MIKQLPIPRFFDEAQVQNVWKVPYEQRFEEALVWRKQHGITHWSSDKTKILHITIDGQNTFCTPGYELVVAGAVEDMIRHLRFGYKYLHVISKKKMTMDTHFLMQIFHRMYLINEAGEHPQNVNTPGNGIISHDDIKSGKWKLNPGVCADVAPDGTSLGKGNYNALREDLLHYTEQLETSKKSIVDGADLERYALTIWPFHGSLGSISHALVSALEELAFFHGVCRQSQPGYEIKGGNFIRENYSPLGVEVKTVRGTGGQPEVRYQKNVRLIEDILTYDMVIADGWASSHCFAWFANDLIEEIYSKDKALARKVYFLSDCTSPVKIGVPAVDQMFADKAKAAFDRCRDAGINVVKSTDPIESWPGVTL